MARKRYKKKNVIQDRVIHSCYMTGQKCVYLRALLGTEQSGAFVLCPFGGDFDHIYNIYLKKLDISKIGVAGEVKRADSVARTGYVMCSRICFQIQQSAVIIADITRPNLNVFYELGLACALGKRIVLLAHKEAAEEYILNFVKSLGLESHLLCYSGGPGSIEDDVLFKAQPVTMFRVDRSDSPRGSGMHVPVFSNDGMEYLKLGQDKQLVSRERVICHTAEQALKELKSQAKVESIIERCHMLLDERGDSKRSIVVTRKRVEKCISGLLKGIYCVHDKAVSSMPREDTICQAVTQADLILIDASLDDFETYFWFGLCHGLQKEVVPLSVTDKRVPEISLPFDIRTLWHIYGSFLHPLNVTEQLLQILIEVTAKLIDTRAVIHRENFWKDIIHSPKVSFYLGTEQSKQLRSRQVMGEWDLRTFQEISSFTARSNPNLDLSIEKPAFRRDEFTDEDREAFKRLLRDKMGKSHGVIIGTPDVNPVAEMVLSELKSTDPFVQWFRDDGQPKGGGPGPTPMQSKTEGYIPFKYHEYSYSSPRPTTFFLQYDSKKPVRGFHYYDKERTYVNQYAEPYVPREECKPDPGVRKFENWKLLGHLVVALNPFSKDFPDPRYRIILIMGIGGPATLGLAHLLTGRPPECFFRKWKKGRIAKFISVSDGFLKNVNDLLSVHGAVEAIIRIEVLNDLASMNNEFEDSREIQGIEIAPPLSDVGNPKPFVIVSQNGTQ